MLGVDDGGPWIGIQLRAIRVSHNCTSQADQIRGSNVLVDIFRGISNFKIVGNQQDYNLVYTYPSLSYS